MLSSIGPVGLGILRDLTGNYQTSLWLLVALSGALMAASFTLTPARLHRGVRSRPEPVAAA